MCFSNACSFLSLKLDNSEEIAWGLLPSAGRRASGAMECDISADETGTMSAVPAVAQRTEGSWVDEARRTCPVLQKLEQQILMTTEQIRIEQEARDDNVAEYLRLAQNANKQQAFRIKKLFEKTNHRCAQTIADLRKKMEDYRQEFKEIQQAPARQPKEALVNMQQGSEDVGANKTKVVGRSFIGHKPSSTVTPQEFEGCSVDTPQSVFITSASRLKYGSDDKCSSDSVTGSTCARAEAAREMRRLWDTLLEDLPEVNVNSARMENAMETTRCQMQRGFSYTLHCLEKEIYRHDLLEEQLNDLTELHLNEMSNLKQELASMEEMVAYQSDESSREAQEVLESCVDRVTKLELHLELQQQQQQVVQLEEVEKPNNRTRLGTLLGKLINIILSAIAAVLVVVFTPLIKTQTRGTATLILFLTLFILWKHWRCLELWYFQTFPCPGSDQHHVSF
ncbi:hypothetical protein DPEC_G00212800 [Dallia pectoralis]|uniref:Uncharacterized protein n=1 Tax=Dallia pectoralis TaxID=75939 RepID=A0ACC2G6I2_DALPE|nr:hypothetical protein DPEC_G00212800 [Dallia pectoralis]